MSLVINNLSKRFDNSEKSTLNNVSLDIQTGEFVCIVGASGCGKTTLLNLIAGLETPTEGEVLVDGVKVTKPGADRAVMFQEHGLYPWMNVLENVTFPLKLAKIPKEEQEKRANYYLEMVGLSEYKNYPIHQISGGMKQRTALARALVMDSKVLLMDEPFSALDKQTSNQLREELQRIWLETHKTIVFITHSVEESVYLADKVVVLSPKTGSICDIVNIDLERPRHVYSSEFVEFRHKILDEVKGENLL
ncbi:MAG: ABC transporter ATP-binding protein [Oscillospiraceae bacterium]|nr:ABC transporter ATP-binding protein [Oscillospiraceae bacterium]